MCSFSIACIFLECLKDLCISAVLGSRLNSGSPYKAIEEHGCAFKSQGQVYALMIKGHSV